jgi:hypothetical protein
VEDNSVNINKLYWRVLLAGTSRCVVVPGAACLFDFVITRQFPKAALQQPDSGQGLKVFIMQMILSALIMGYLILRGEKPYFSHPNFKREYFSEDIQRWILIVARKRFIATMIIGIAAAVDFITGFPPYRALILLCLMIITLYIILPRRAQLIRIVEYYDNKVMSS